MTIEERKEYVLRIYGLACAAGLCKSRKEFADLLEINYTTLSSAMNGAERMLTESLVGRVRKFSRQNCLDGEQPDPKFPPAQGGVWIPTETAQLYNNMSETIRIQAEIIARFQAMPGPQKNSTLDNRWGK